MTAAATERRYLNVRQLAEYIDSTEGSVRQLVCQRRVPFLRVAGGRRVLFDVLLIDRWLAEQTVEPAADRGPPTQSPEGA